MLIDKEINSNSFIWGFNSQHLALVLQINMLAVSVLKAHTKPMVETCSEIAIKTT